MHIEISNYSIQDQQYRGLDYTDGTFCDVRYFNCEDECGLFVALDKLSIDPEGNTLEAAPRGGQNYAKSVSHGSATSDRLYPQGGGPPADNTRARSQAVQQQNVQRHDDRLPRYKKGDRVVAFDKTGNRIHGTVRWIGTTDRTQHFIVGIETVSSGNFCFIQASLKHCIHSHCLVLCYKTRM